MDVKEVFNFRYRISCRSSNTGIECQEDLKKKKKRVSNNLKISRYRYRIGVDYRNLVLVQKEYDEHFLDRLHQRKKHVKPYFTGGGRGRGKRESLH